MPVRLLLMVYRKPDLTPEQFKHYYEGSHLVLVRALTGDAFPLTHTRRYIPRSAPRQSSAYGGHTLHYPAMVVSGSPTEFEFDCISELTFGDLDHLQSFFAVMMMPEISARVTEDCARFMDMSRVTPTVILDDYIESSA